MSARTTLHCETVHGFSSCAASLMTDGITHSEARAVGAACGWRYSGGKDYCPACSGSRIRPRLIAATTAPTMAVLPPLERLEQAGDILIALVNEATGSDWWYSRTDPFTDLVRLPPSEGVGTGTSRRGSACVAATGPAGQPQAARDAAYIACVDRPVGRAVAAVLREARESLADDLGIVQDSSTQAAIDVADALLRPRQTPPGKELL